MNPIHCMVVEDEPLAQNVMRKHISACADLKLAGICSHAVRAYEWMNTARVDLLFLDISLPVVNGLDFIRSLKAPPAVIFTTAYSEYAAASYDLEAVDYLLKPVTFERFSQAVSRFRRMREQPPAPKEEYLFLKEGGRLIRVLYREILYIEARKDYLCLHTAGRRLITYGTMKAMEERLPAPAFIRVHRSYIVARAYITGLSAHTVEIGTVQLPVGEKYRAHLAALFSA